MLCATTTLEIGSHEEYFEQISAYALHQTACCPQFRTKKRLSRRWRKTIPLWRMQESCSGASKSGADPCHCCALHALEGMLLCIQNHMALCASWNSSDLTASDVCRDKTRPKAWYEPEDLTILPEANALDPSLGEKVQTWFQNLRKWDGLIKAPALPAWQSWHKPTARQTLLVAACSFAGDPAIPVYYIHSKLVLVFTMNDWQGHCQQLLLLNWCTEYHNSVKTWLRALKAKCIIPL